MPRVERAGILTVRWPRPNAARAERGRCNLREATVTSRTPAVRSGLAKILGQKPLLPGSAAARPPPILRCL